MNELKMVLRLAKAVRTPQQAAALVMACIIGIAIIYFLPPDLIDRI